MVIEVTREELEKLKENMRVGASVGVAPRPADAGGRASRVPSAAEPTPKGAKASRLGCPWGREATWPRRRG